MGSTTLTCGDHGGTRQDGEPCTQPVQNEGQRCHYHPPKGRGATEQRKEKAVEGLQEYPEKSLEGALVTYFEEDLDEAAPSRSTFWRWRQSDEDFARQFEELYDDRVRRRLELIEDSMIERVIAGNTSGAVTIFTIVNLARQAGLSGRWQDLRHLDVTTRGGKKIPLGAVDEVRDGLESGDVSLDDVRNRLAAAKGNGAGPSENGGG